MARRNANGEGTIYRRKDGRWEGAIYLLTTSGTQKRFRAYGATRAEVHRKITEAKQRQQQGIAAPNKAWKLGDYLDYWLENIVQPTRRPTTFIRYEVNVRLYLKPHLGRYQLPQLTVPIVQAFLNEHIESGHSIRSAQIARTVLSAALTSAQREELVMRNVARLVELPSYDPDEVVPWTEAEVRKFLQAAQQDRLFVAFLMLVGYGLRLGEVLGLRWEDIDWHRGGIRVRQQIQRLHGTLRAEPLKTKASRRDLPMVDIVRLALGQMRRAITADGEIPTLVFTTSSGHALDPRNFARSFHRLCEAHGIRRIRVHDVRHTAATLLKLTKAHPRDAQVILGHSNIATTLQIYQHSSEDSRRDAVQGVEVLLSENSTENANSQASLPGRVMSALNGHGSRQLSRQGRDFVDRITSFLSGTPGWVRTSDLRLRRSTDASLNDRLTSVSLLVRDQKRRWLLGCVAVNLAVKNQLPHQHKP